MINDESDINKPENKFSNKTLLGLLLLLIICSVSTYTFINKFSKNRVAGTQKEQQSQAKQTETSQDVLGLGHGRSSPQIFIYGGNQKYSSGGMIALASTDEPAVQIGGYNTQGEAEIAVYEANEGALLDYLTHDKEGKQTKRMPDLSKFQYVTTVKHNLNTGSYEGSKVTLPLKETGIWYLNVKIGQSEVGSYVIRSNFGVITKEGENEMIFWGQDFKTKRSITGGVIKILDLENSPKELQTTSFNSEGIAKANINPNADIALIQRNDDRVVVPINLIYLNLDYSYKRFLPRGRLTRYFIFTDRPLYKPGDTVYFKAILRDDNDARYTIPQGEAFARIYDDYYYEGSDKQPLFEKKVTISPDGTINGEYQLPTNAKVGNYTLAIKTTDQPFSGDFWDSEWTSNTIYFDVQFFRKPEFWIDIATPKRELIARDKLSFKIKGQYFSGQPLIGQEVKYIVYSSEFYEYEYALDQQRLSQTLNDDYHYGYWHGNNKIKEGVATLDKYGEAEIEIDTQLESFGGKTQVFSIEATTADGSQNPSFSRRNVLVYAGEYGIYRKDNSSYTTRVDTPLSLPVILIPNKANADISNINLTAKIHRENWIPYQEENKKYLSFKKEEEDLPQMTVKTDGQGNATLTFTPTKVGSYTITVEGKDARGNLISKVFYAYVSREGQPHYTTDTDNGLTIATDKQRYNPTDKVQLNIFSSIPNRDVFLSLERGRVDRFQIIHLNGKSANIEIPLLNTDIPNIYADVSSFSDYTLDSSSKNIPIVSDSKRLLIGITPNSKTFGPGETVTVDISTTDIAGNPASAELALWAVDKAIFELSDNKLDDIFNTFWKQRINTTQQAHSLEGILVTNAEGGGCFAKGTLVLMADGKYKNIEDIKAGDYVLTRTEKDSELVKARVVKTHTTEESGYLIINGGLKVTADHILRVNDSWREAGSIQVGDALVDSQGNAVYVESIEWQAGKIQVYNLEIENYHTFFAGGVWVHNQKGAARSVFKDTAYWNPTIHTDSSGKAKISFKLPDNLTTWTLAAVGTTLDTRVGQTTDEIVVTKDIIVRPIVPNILRTGDEIVLSALVQNFTQTEQDLDVSLSFDSGNVDTPNQKVLLKPNQIQQVYWRVEPTVEKDKSKLIFSAKSRDDKKSGDIVTQEIPIRPFGFEEKRAETAEGEKTFLIKLSPDSDKEKSSITLALSPTIIGTLPTAMKYLINYPFGCTEQTTSRFVPAVIAKANRGLFAEALKDKDVDDIIEKSLSRLSALQQQDGGWAWWFSGKSDLFITSYVVEYILEAKRAGVEIEDNLLKKAQEYLERDAYYDPKLRQSVSPTKEESISRNYGLTLLGAKDKVKKITNFDDLKPDLLALAVMSNYLNGEKDPQINGLNKLVSMAQTQGDAVFWEEGDKLNFGSKDTSTALAIRAIILAGGDRNLAAKAARYLTRTRRTDYWTNTYATAQVIRALVDLSKTGSELTPSYNYTVTLDGKQIAQATVSSSTQTIKDIVIPVSSIKASGSNISINKNGEGQIYSTLLINEFHTDRNAQAKNHGLTVKREYINEKGEQYSLAVGDTVIVKITVGGLNADENYAVINDELPSGLVPINQSFKNEQYGYNSNTYYTSYDVTDREVTENGMILSLYQIRQGEHSYTYRARVINEGVFIVPPVTASLMYAPEIYGRSSTQTIKITKESEIIFTKAPKEAFEKHLKQNTNWLIIAATLLTLIGIGALVARKKRLSFSQVQERIKKTLRDRSKPQPQDGNSPTISDDGRDIQ